MKDAELPAATLGGHDPALLIRIEDAGLNASAPPQQRWMDGWLVRTNAGKAQRARCVNAVAAGRQPVAQKLERCRALYTSLGLPFIVRITPFTEPATLGDELAEQGFRFHDDTRVMLLPRLPSKTTADNAWPSGAQLQETDAATFAERVGTLRGSPAADRSAHAQRLRESPVPYRGLVLQRDGQTLACGQFAQEDELVGLYDVATADGARGQGLASRLCDHLLSVAARSGATIGYLQVGADNHAARRIYTRMGFVDAYRYHYRVAPGFTAAPR